MMKYSTTKFGKDENDDKLYKELTTLVPHGWISNLFTLFLCEEVTKKGV